MASQTGRPSSRSVQAARRLRSCGKHRSARSPQSLALLKKGAPGPAVREIGSGGVPVGRCARWAVRRWAVWSVGGVSAVVGGRWRHMRSMFETPRQTRPLSSILQLAEGQQLANPGNDEVTWDQAVRVRHQVQHRLTQPEVELLARCYLEGSTLNELAGHFRVHRRTVMELLERLASAGEVKARRLTRSREPPNSTKRAMPPRRLA